MSQGIEFTSYIPTSLVGVNSASPTLAAEAVTGLPIATGAFPGNCFYLTEQQAAQLSLSTVNSAALLPCHAGWYMVVQIDAGATSGNLLQGAIVAQKAIPTTAAASGANIPPAAVLTDVANVLSLGINPAVLLAPVTAGNYTIVQLAGDSSIYLQASQTTAVGSVLLSSATVGATVGSSNITVTTLPEVIGVAEAVIITPAGALTLSAVAASSGGSAVYTGTITGGGTNNYKGLYFVITGFVGANNNSAGQGAQGFLCTANTTTTLTLVNPIATAETHAGTATSTNLVRANVAFPFGII